jgi:glutaminyl-tRNA synthetase
LVGPPEPNGYWLIGHAESVNMNFILAFDRFCPTICRNDDTNPDAERNEYSDNLERDWLEWLGWNPKLTPYNSDYFQELQDFAAVLI